MDKLVQKAYKFFDLEYCATEQDVEHAALNKTQKIQQKFATNAEKINLNLNKLKEYKAVVIEHIKTGSKVEFEPRKPRFEVGLNSIFTLLGVLMFVLTMCVMSFRLI